MILEKCLAEIDAEKEMQSISIKARSRLIALACFTICLQPLVIRPGMTSARRNGAYRDRTSVSKARRMKESYDILEVIL